MNQHRTLKLAALVAALLTAGGASAAPVAGQGTWETTLQARDINLDGVADAYFDTALNVTWLADAFSDGPPPGLPVGRPLLTPNDGNEWVSALNVYGVTGWRLPKVSNIGGASGASYRTCSTGFDPRLCGANPDPSLSELAHMYFVTLGNTPLTATGGGLTNTANFERLKPIIYWTHTRDEPGDFVWSLNMGSGYQGPIEAVGGSLLGGTWAVHDGDIAAVPEPQADMLMGAGLLAIGLLARRRSAGAQHHQMRN